MTDGILDREKVMLGLEKCTGASSDCEGCPYADENGISCSSIMNIMRDAFALLKEQEPRVLKYNEIGGHPLVWLEDDDKEDVIPAIFLQYNGWNAEFIRQSPNEYVRTVVSSATVYAVEEVYGLKWRCWTSRPTDDQRKAAVWDA